VKRDTALIAARKVKLPLQATAILKTAVTIEATYGVFQAVRLAKTSGSIPSSAKAVQTRGPNID